MCKNAAWMVSVHRVSLKKKVNISGFRLSPYYYVKAKFFIRKILKQLK